MGLFTWRQEPPSSLVASAAQIRLDDKTEARRVLKRRQEWQRDAFDYFDSLGEVKFGANFVGNALSKLRLFIGFRPTPDDDPVSVLDVPENERPRGWQQAIDALDRLRSPIAGHAEILRRYGVNITLVGECYLVGLDKDDDAKERWAVHSIEELIPKTDGQFQLIDPVDEHGQQSDKPKVLADPADFTLRIWIPHPRRTQLADSPLHGVLEICEELLLLERAVRAQAKSRIPAGLLAIPEELSSGPLQPTGGDGEEATEDKFLEDLARALVTPIQDEQDASAVVPLVVRGKGDLLEKMQHITFSRDSDKYLEERTERALRRFAQGVNVPPEVILGLADTNHWNAWLITDETFRGIEPLAVIGCDALSLGYLHPTIGKAGVAPEDAQKLLVWYDPARLVVRPNKAQDAKDLHASLVISDHALRQATDFDDEDAPEEDELARREKRARPVARDVPVDEDPGPPEEEPEAEEEAPTEDEGETASAITAAARSDVSDIGRRLHQIDRELKARLEASFDAALRRALERAGSMIWNKAKSKPNLKDVIQGVARTEMAATLGAKIVGGLGLSDEAMLESAIDGLKDSFNRWVERAQGAALNLVPGLIDAERSVIEPLQIRDRQDAWEWTRAALLTAARSLLYNPAPDPPEMGEFDSGAIVPPSLIRECVARAGGAVSEVAPVSAAAAVSDALFLQLDDPIKAVFGVAQGWLMQNVLGEHGVAVEEFEWVYGDYPRSKPFLPHQDDLNGVRFKNFDDDVLLNMDSFPETSHYIPGDHENCNCDCMLVTVEVAA